MASDPEEARERLKLCPLTMDWMMLATWRLAHPFGVPANGANRARIMRRPVA